MSDLERFWLGDDEYGDPALVPASDGHWVRFSDVAEREARFQARIEELEAGIRDVQNDLRQSRATLEDLRSLLDSGEESRPDPVAVPEKVEVNRGAVERGAKTICAWQHPRWEWDKLRPEARDNLREQARCVLRAALEQERGEGA